MYSRYQVCFVWGGITIVCAIIMGIIGVKNAFMDPHLAGTGLGILVGFVGTIVLFLGLGLLYVIVLSLFPKASFRSRVFAMLGLLALLPLGYGFYISSMWDRVFWIGRGVYASSATARIQAVHRLDPYLEQGNERAMYYLKCIAHDPDVNVRKEIAIIAPELEVNDADEQVRLFAARSPHLQRNNETIAWAGRESSPKIRHCLALRCLLLQVESSLVSAWFADNTPPELRREGSQIIAYAFSKGDTPINEANVPTDHKVGLPKTWEGRAVLTLSTNATVWHANEAVIVKTLNGRADRLAQWITWCVSVWPRETGSNGLYDTETQIAFLTYCITRANLTAADASQLQPGLTSPKAAIRSATSVALAATPGRQADIYICQAAGLPSLTAVHQNLGGLIRAGVPGSEGAIIRILQLEGTINYAEVLLNSHHPWLVTYALQWAADRNYKQQYGHGAHEGIWGQDQPSM